MGSLSEQFLGITVHRLTINTIHDYIDKEIRTGGKCIIAHHNLHSLYIFHKDEKMREFYQKAQYAHVDGMSLIFLGRLLGASLQRSNRITYLDWIYPLMEESAKKGYRVLFLGSRPGVAAKAANQLKAKIANLQLKTLHGYFDAKVGSQENNEVLRLINDYKPHILMVGMGMPRQEYWILDNISHIKANVILSAGACMDYVAGEVPSPPRWMGQLGFEWLYRLLSEPRRLWKRYLVEPWFILKIILLEIIIKKNSRERRSNL